GAPRTEGRGALEVPDAGAEAEVAVGERADGTDVGDVRRVRIVEGLPGRQRQEVVVAALVEGELVGLRHLVEEAHAARAEHAALLVEYDVGTEDERLALVDLGRERHAAPLAIVVHVVLLELALAGLIAHRAVDRVVDEQELEDGLLGGDRLVALRVHDHAVAHPGVAGDLQLGRLLDLHQAHAAVAGDGEPRMPAVVGDLDAEAVRGLDDGDAVLHRDRPAVDLNRGHGLAGETPRGGTDSGRAPRAARTRSGTW